MNDALNGAVTDTQADVKRVSNRRLIALAIVSLLAVIGALVVPIPYRGRIAVAIGDLVHGPLFLIVTIGVLYLLQRLRPIAHTDRRALLVRCVLVFIVMSGFGIGMELVQHVIGRSAAVHDAMANALGTAAAICCFVGWNRRAVSKRWTGWVALGVGLILCAWYRPLTILKDIYAVKSEFPTLCSFESEMQLTRWYFHECSASITQDHVTDGRYATKLDFQKTKYPAATLIELNSDWRQCKSIELDVVLDGNYKGDGVTLIVKVLDRKRQTEHSDTFRIEKNLQPGKPVSIHATREELLAGPDLHELDLSDIQYISIALVHPERAATVYVDALRLTI